MASSWNEADEAAQDAVAAQFGELVYIEPRIARDYTASRPDSSRPAVTVTGVVSSAIADTDIRGSVQGGQQTGGTRIAAAPVELWLPAATWRQLGYEVHHADAVVLIERPGEPRYSVTRIHESDQGDHTLYLAGENP